MNILDPIYTSKFRSILGYCTCILIVAVSYILVEETGIQYRQGHLNSIIHKKNVGPGQSSALGPLPTQPLTGIKMYKWWIEVNILYWYFQQNQCLNIQKNMTYTTYTDYHGVLMLMGPPGNCPACPRYTEYRTTWEKTMGGDLY